MSHDPNNPLVQEIEAELAEVTQEIENAVASGELSREEGDQAEAQVRDEADFIESVFDPDGCDDGAGCDSEGGW